MEWRLDHGAEVVTIESGEGVVVSKLDLLRIVDQTGEKALGCFALRKGVNLFAGAPEFARFRFVGENRGAPVRLASRPEQKR